MHFNFLNNATIIESALQGTYDPALVMLSLVVASIASYSAFTLTKKINIETHNIPLNWLILGAVTQGMGIWAMHFIGMLAFQLPITITVNYDPWITVISIIPAILASFVVFLTSRNQSNILVNSIYMGLGIGTMHYIGMSGLIMNAIMLYDPVIFIISIFIAILLVYIALRLKLWAEKNSNSLDLFDNHFIIASTVMGLAIAATHYSAMFATFYFPGNNIPINDMTISPETLAWSIGTATTVIILSLLTATRISHRFETLKINQQNDARLNSIIDNTSEGIISIDENGLIEIFNHGAEKIFGYQQNEMIGKNTSILLTPEEKSHHDTYIRQSNLHAPRILNKNRDLQGQKKDGAIFPVEINLSPINYHNNNGFVAIIRDITERKRIEKELILAKEQAESSSKAKMKFISHMSHELRTPLNSILGFSQIMMLDEKEPPSDWQKNNLEKIGLAGDHLLKLINNILDLSSIESGHIKLNITSININELISEGITNIKPELDKYQLTLKEITHECNDIYVRADHLRLKQILLNVLSNACKYNKQEGLITIDCENINNNSIRINKKGIASKIAKLYFNLSLLIFMLFSHSFIVPLTSLFHNVDHPFFSKLCPVGEGPFHGVSVCTGKAKTGIVKRVGHADDLFFKLPVGSDRNALAVSQITVNQYQQKDKSLNRLPVHFFCSFPLSLVDCF